MKTVREKREAKNLGGVQVTIINNVEKQVADYLGMNESDFATRETRNPQSSSGSGCCRLTDRN